MVCAQMRYLIKLLVPSVWGLLFITLLPTPSLAQSGNCMLECCGVCVSWCAAGVQCAPDRGYGCREAMGEASPAERVAICQEAREKGGGQICPDLAPFCEEKGPCQELKGQLNEADSQGPKQLASKCEKLRNSLQRCPEETASYCAVTDCFKNGAWAAQINPLGAPGPLTVLEPFFKNLPPLPPGKRIHSLPSDPVVITKDTCGPLLHLMREAESVMSAMGMKPRQQHQQEAIACLERRCNRHAWRTTFP